MKKPQWATRAGKDRYGHWAEFAYRGVTQRMRWIPPGTFQMGSPPEEPERCNDEAQHEVELTQGFWLADTACTQALWQAVMGANPSKFKGAERPVETVSWDDCQKFIERINADMPGLDLQLPTEAQWEYACRAGTETPFSFGATVTPKQVNYDGNYPYAGGEKGPCRQETVAVKSLPPNPWGLYEMHGNVWEWCTDRYGTYDEGRVVDPQGPYEGEFRVLRGGCWFIDAWRCRTSIRIFSNPGTSSVLFGFFGFRLFRGQGQDQDPIKKKDPIQVSCEATQSKSEVAPACGGSGFDLPALRSTCQAVERAFPGARVVVFDATAADPEAEVILFGGTYWGTLAERWAGEDDDDDE